MKYKEGTLSALSNGWERTFTLKLYKNTILSEDGTLVDFTEATGTNYIEKTLLWADAVIVWDVDKYTVSWPEQAWSDLSALDADGYFIEDGTVVFSAVESGFGTDYNTLGITPSILMG